MELIPVNAFAKALQEQGFEVEIDQDSRGNRWMNIYQGDRFLTVFPIEPQDHRGRNVALAACRRHGFVW